MKRRENGQKLKHAAISLRTSTFYSSVYHVGAHVFAHETRQLFVLANSYGKVGTIMYYHFIPNLKSIFMQHSVIKYRSDLGDVYLSWVFGIVYNLRFCRC